MTDTATIWLPEAKATQSAGSSLARTLYTAPITIGLSGELGAGKTTFLQGFAAALGISENLTSPTFALEQRYTTVRWGEFLHVDLYRLSPEQARDLIKSSESHHGIRCIEWAERLPFPLQEDIAIQLDDPHDKEGRTLTVSFNDIRIPSSEQIEAWRNEWMLPVHITKHCDAVAAFAVELGTAMLKRGELVRLNALNAAGRLHDLLRFLDFKDGASHGDDTPTEEEPACWKQAKKRFPNQKHEAACASFLREEGYDAVAAIVVAHGLVDSPVQPTTIEQKILFYADKRMMVDTLVSLEKRFEDFAKRYGTSPLREVWLRKAKAAENELFPDGPSR